MSNWTENFSEVYNLLAHIPAYSETVAVTSGWLNLEIYQRVIVLISVGDLAGAATFDCAITQDDTGTGGNAKALVPVKASTQLTAADDDVANIIELRTEELDVDGGFNWILVTCTPAVAAVEFSVMVFGLVASYAPVAVANWNEIVVA